MPHLLAISIGPVQEFIAAGRKTHDLWFGSWMLGQISRAVAQDLRRAGATLVFPHPDALQRDEPIANKVLAMIETGEPATLAEEARQAACEELDRYHEQLIQELRHRRATDLVDATLIRDQINRLLEWAAAWVPYERPNYGASRERMELLLDGRKALRDFDQPYGAHRPKESLEGVPKSSLDPSRESALRQKPRRLDEGERRRLALKRGEELDGVSLVKRLVQPRRFVSVSRVAIDPFIRRVAAAPEHAVDLEPLRASAKALGEAGAEPFGVGPGSGLEHYAAFPYDTQLFYDDAEDDAELTPEERKAAAAFRALVRGLKGSLQIGELPTYFAVLLADGDKMGAAISRMRESGQHQALSAALARFAQRADDVVRAHSGALVYSGGDDVLAFLPLDRALDCADALRRTFAEVVADAAAGEAVSLSVGVAIGHYSEHLQNLLSWGRAAEAAAKAGGRNSLAVALHTRSGGAEATTVVHSWDADPVAQRWNRWIDWHRRDAIPDGAAYELRALVREFARLPELARHTNVLISEAERITARKRAERGGRPLAEGELQHLREAMDVGETPFDGLERLVNELIVARRIAATVSVARGPHAGEEAHDER